jgi:phosphoribosylanthranilate isomerase
MQDQQNLDQVCASEPEMVGFIFYSPSPRYVYADDRAKVLKTPEGVKRVGVFVDEESHRLCEEAKRWELHAIQLHGDEPPEYCLEIKGQLPKREVYKVFRVGESFKVEEVSRYLSAVDALLFDTATSGYGGSGRVFSWADLQSCPGELPIVLSGGLSAETFPAQRVLLAGMPELQQRVIAYDFNSGVEASPGVKDPDLVKAVITMVRKQ